MISNLITLFILVGEAEDAARRTLGVVCDYAELIPTQTVVWHTLVCSIVVCSLLWGVLTRYSRSQLHVGSDGNRKH
jgi:hypothetical protein